MWEFERFPKDHVRMFLCLCCLNEHRSECSPGGPGSMALFCGTLFLWNYLHWDRDSCDRHIQHRFTGFNKPCDKATDTYVHLVLWSLEVQCFTYTFSNVRGNTPVCYFSFLVPLIWNPQSSLVFWLNMTSKDGSVYFFTVNKRSKATACLFFHFIYLTVTKWWDTFSKKRNNKTYYIYIYIFF